MRLFSILIFILFTTIAMAQLDNKGVWSSVSVEKKVGEIDWSAETELRTIYGVQLVDRWSLGLGADYRVNDYLKVALGYSLMNTLDSKYYNYQFRHRFNALATGRVKVDRFTFSLRERLQLTTKNDSKRIRDDGSIDTYQINPALVWRNRLQMEYNIRKSKFTPSLSAESSYELNNPDGNTFYKMRYILNVDYKINKRNTIALYTVLNQGLDDDEDSYDKYVLGVSYNIQL